MESHKLTLDALVADPNFYGRDQNEVKNTLGELQALSEQIDAAYLRWEELEKLQTSN
jgi:hypothetical protein